MKRFYMILISLLTIGSMYAQHCNLYIEDITVEADQDQVTIPIKADFTHWVSAIQVDLELPEGLTVQRFEEGYDLTIPATNREGIPYDYYPTTGVNQAKTRYIAISSQADYYNGQNVGVVKWEPGNYEMWYLTFRISDNFKGGTIRVTGVTASGQDLRPWVTTCDDCWSDNATKVTVNGIEEPETGPYDIGYWLVIGNPGEEQYVQLDEDMNTMVELRGGQYENLKIPYRFIVFGEDYGSQTDGEPTDMNDFWNNYLEKGSTRCYTLDGEHRYKLHTEYYMAKVMFIECYVMDTDGVDEIVADKQVKDVRYYNINGQEMAQPNGITIVVTTYTDGTHSTAKIAK